VLDVVLATLLFMAFTGTFTYEGGANPPIDYPRMLVADTVQFGSDGTTPIFAFWDQEIQAATQIELAVWQSGMFWSGPQGISPFTNSNVIPWRRIAATLIDALASNQARISLISSQLDTKLNPGAVKDMQAQAQALRDADDNSGAFVIIEQVNDGFSFIDRYWKTVMRQSAGVSVG
jgi:hypothetical protein